MTDFEAKKQEILEHWIRGYKNDSQSVFYTASQALRDLDQLYLEELESKSTLVIEHGADYEDKKQYWAVSVETIKELLSHE